MQEEDQLQSGMKRIVLPVLWSAGVSLFSATAVHSADSIVVWGYFSPTNVPASLTNVVSLAAGYGFNVALTAEGRATAWGTGFSQTNVPAGLSNVIAVAAGRSHALALKSDGTVVGWGENDSGQVFPPAGLSNAVAIAAGNSHSIALKSDGAVVAWGYSDTTNAPGVNGLVSIGAGAYHSLAVKSDGTVLAWGNGYDGMNVPAGLSNVVAVAGTERQSMALRADGRVLFWGNNGCGTTTVPASLSNIVAISAQDSLSLALKSDGTVFAWGCVVLETNLPVGLSNVIAIAAGPDHGVALRLVGTNTPPPVIMRPRALIGTLDRPFYSRITAKYASLGYGVVGLPPGLNLDATTGIITGTPIASGTFSVSLLATNETGVGQLSTKLFINLPLPSITSSRAVIASMSVGFQYQITAENGPTSFGAVGLPPGLSLSQATGLITGVPTQSGAFAVSLTATNSYGTAAATLGLTVIEVAAWGENNNGQMNLPPTLTNVIAISASLSGNAPLALRSDGTVVGWGGAPSIPAGLSNVVAIAAGFLSSPSLALRADGTVVGFAGSGSPSLPSGLTNVVAIANGAYSLALKADGTVVIFNGSTIVSGPPDLVNIVAIATGIGFAGGHVLALRSDGTVVAWGFNSSGQTNVPAGLSNVVTIAAGVDTSFAFQADGTLIRWGAALVPAGLTNLAEISAGTSHALSLRNDARVLAWGSNTSGQTNVPAALSNVVAVVAAGRSSYALVGNPAGTAPPVFVGPRALVATVDRAFQLRIPVKNGATGFSATGLPPGLQLNPLTGIITGNPAAAGIYSVTISATNAAGLNQFTMTMHVNIPLPTITSSRVAYAYPGLLFTYRIIAANSPTSFATTGLPPSLTLNPATGLISGVFTALGTHSILLSASNAYGVVTTTLTLGVTEIAAWGDNSAGQLSVPGGLSNLLAVSAGGTHNLALRADGSVSGWGANTYGQATPPVGLSNVTAVSAGSAHSLALKQDGTVVAWGGSSSAVTNVPAGLSIVIAIAAADDHSLALKSDGTITSWGFDSYGEAALPTDLTNITAVATGEGHTIALRANGTVFVQGFFWATNGFPSGLSNVVAIAAGGGHGLALKLDGSVVSWGGAGTQPQGLTNVVAIAAGGGIRTGGGHSIALKSDGTVVAWGGNSSGQTIVPQGLRKVSSISAGGSHSLALIGGTPNFGIDLVLTNLSLSTNQLGVGSSVSISWQGRNRLGLPTHAYWTDGFFLSHDDKWDFGDILLGTSVYAGDLATNEIYAKSLTIQVPGVLPGNYYLVARADTYFQLNEGLDEANNVIALGPLPVAVPALQIGALPTAGTLTPNANSSWFAVDVSQGQSVVLRLSSFTASNLVMHGSSTNIPTANAYTLTTTTVGGTNQYLVFSGNQPGIHYVTVSSLNALTNTIGFTLNAQTSGFTVLDTGYGQGGNFGSLTLRISGAAFDRGMTAKVIGGGTERAATGYWFENETVCYATFDLRNLSPGMYSVELRNGTGVTVNVANGLQVVAVSQVPEMIPELSAPPRVGFNRAFSFAVSWRNDGLNDLPAPLLKVGHSVPFGLSPGDYSLGTRYAFLGTSTQGGPPGILRPGQRESLTFHSFSGIEAVDGYYAYVDRAGKNPAVPMDWNEVILNLPRGSLGDAQFNAVLTQFTNQIGPTWGHYLAMLSRNASLLSASVGDQRSPRDLEQLEWRKALAAQTLSISGRIVSDSLLVNIGDVEIVAVPDGTNQTYVTSSLADGGFIIPEIRPALYSMEARDTRGHLLSPVIADTRSGLSISNVVLNLPIGADLIVEVVDSHTNPVANALVTIGSITNPVAVAATGSDGLASLFGLPLGAQPVLIEAVSNAPQVMSVSVAVGTVTRISVILNCGARISGHAKLINGMNATNALLSLESQTYPGALTRFARTAENGSFEIAGVADGPYTMTIVDLASGAYTNSVFLSSSVPLDVGEIILPMSPPTQNLLGPPTGNPLFDLMLESLELDFRIQRLPLLYGFFGTQVGDLWKLYLDSTTDQPAGMQGPFVDGSSIVDRKLMGFRSEAQRIAVFDSVLAQAAEAIRAKFNAGVLVWPCNEHCEADSAYEFLLPVEACVSNAVLNIPINFSNPFTIPGNIAGGADPAVDPRDKRRITGMISVTTQGRSLSRRFLSVKSRLELIVDDVIDFLPGQLGSPAEQWFGTTALRELERYRWAYDVPFQVRVSDTDNSRVKIGRLVEFNASNEPCDAANCDPTKQPAPPGPQPPASQPPGSQPPGSQPPATPTPDSYTHTEKPRSVDPNDIYAPTGYGDLHWLARQEIIPYTIRFENDPAKASAPAQIVRVTTKLDADLNFQTFRLNNLSIGDLVVDVPEGQQQFTTRLNLTTNLGVYVDVAVTFNPATGDVSWTLTSVDPATGALPDDPLIGFLPPNTNGVVGQGYVSFMVQPKSTSSTGTRIDAQASIVFDYNAPILTPPIFHTLDSQAPSSQVTSLPSVVGRTFNVRWSGQDAGGSGIESFDIYVATNGVKYVRWLDSTQTTNALFVGALGNTYSFYSAARDWVGYSEAPPGFRDTQTTVSTNSPVLTAVSNLVIEVGEALQITNLVQGMPTGPYLFSLTGSPAGGATVNPTNGVFRWTPECRQGNTTNSLLLWVTDSGATNLSDAMFFTVAVRECVTPQIGTVVVRAGDDARVPINLVSTVELTNLVMALRVPAGRFTNFWLENVAAEICARTVLEEANTLYWLNFVTCTNQSLIGTQQLAWLWLTAITNQNSAIVPLNLTDLLGVRLDGVVVTNLFAGSGRVVVVGEAPLLEAAWGTNGAPVITLYGQTGRDHILQTATNVVGPWSLQPPFTMTNLWLAWTVPTNVPQQFYRAKAVVP